VFCPKCNRKVHALNWSTDGIITFILRERHGLVCRVIRTATPHRDDGDFSCPKCGAILFNHLKAAKEALIAGADWATRKGATGPQGRGE
jgi:hypothetical protein